jgi:hypothetical protein
LEWCREEEVYVDGRRELLVSHYWSEVGWRGAGDGHRELLVSHYWSGVREGVCAGRDEFSLPRAQINFRRCREALNDLSRFKVNPTIAPMRFGVHNRVPVIH